MSGRHLLPVLLCIAMPLARGLGADEPFFSGPQVGESLAPFKIKAAFADETIDPVTRASGKPILLIFVHQLTRPSVATVRAVAKFVELRRNDVQGAVVFLGDDMTALEQRLKRARHALPKYPIVGMSADGAEGPGAYGLNRNATLTILIGSGGVVRANFALKDASVAVDVPKIVQACCEVIGGEPPKLSELSPRAAMRRASGGSTALPDLLRSVIRKTATNEQVDAAAKKVEEYVSKNRAAARRLGEILDRIVAAGKLDQYGTEHARKYLKRWHDRYGANQKTRQQERKQKS